MRPLLLALALTAALPVPAAAQGDPDIWTYARSCFERLHLDASELQGPFDCRQGKRLVAELEGDVLDLDRCQGSHCPTDLPASCDYGAWLDDACYGHSFIQVLNPPSNPQVKAALLCRHKTRWELGPAPLLDLEGNPVSGFDDIAMIVHNRGNGETCWFQSHTGAQAHLDGTSVAGPHTVSDHDFWMRPTQARDILCINCHDSGPWMNSRWLNNVIGEELAGSMVEPLKSPYRSSEPPFDTWPAARFVELADDDTCTACHHIAAARPGARTCSDWIRRATGQPHIKASQKGHSFEVAYWMPEGHGLETVEEWSQAYRGKVERIIACCDAVGGKPESQWPQGCRLAPPAPGCPVAEAADGSCPVTP